MENRDDLNSLSIDELRARLNDYGLSAFGTRNELINRLYDAYEAENDEESRVLDDARKQMALEKQNEKHAYEHERWNQANANASNASSGYLSSLMPPPMPPNSMSMMHSQNPSLHSNQNIPLPGAGVHENQSSQSQGAQNRGQVSQEMTSQSNNMPPPSMPPVNQVRNSNQSMPPFPPQSQGIRPQTQMMPPPHGFPPLPPKHVSSQSQNMASHNQNLPLPTSQGMAPHQGIMPPGHGMPPPPPPPLHQRMPPPPSQRMPSHQGMQQTPPHNQSVLHNSNQRIPPPNQNMNFSGHRMPLPPQGMPPLNQRMPPPPPPNRGTLPPGIPPPIPGVPPSSQGLHFATSNQNLPSPSQNMPPSNQNMPPSSQGLPMPSHLPSVPSNFLPPNQNMSMPPPSSTSITLPSQSMAIPPPSQEMPPPNIGIPPPTISLLPPKVTQEITTINKDTPSTNLMNSGNEITTKSQSESDKDKNLTVTEGNQSSDNQKNQRDESFEIQNRLSSNMESREKDESTTKDSISADAPTSTTTTTPSMTPSLSHNQTTSNQTTTPSQQDINAQTQNNEASQNQETSDQDSGKPPSLMSLNVAKPSEQGSKDIALPHALEKALAFKDERAQQLGVDPDEVQPMIVEEEIKQAPPPPPKSLVPIDDDEEEGEIKSKESKNKKRKKKKKQRKARQQKQTDEKKEEETKSKKEEVEIEYIQEAYTPSDPAYFQFVRIFEKFKLQEPEKPKEQNLLEQPSEGQKQVSRLIERKKPADIDEDDDMELNKEDEKVKLSKKKLKKLTRMSIAELKQKVGRPDLVEMHDVTAKDPVLLLYLKATRNTVPVPRHWCFKRKYLQGKRGIEKPPFQLPEFIKKTGIMEMRQALQEKEEQKTLKSKMRERVRPKLGKIDIDYQKLHDAFFKWQTKPKMTIHGDLYYEGKEFETRLKEKKPGDLSEELRVALGMPTGPNAHKCPPPWLIAMQRYGPPPSYPNLKIPGLNAPIPEGCSFGYHAGGWGKPPVDESGRPLYGDVFGTQISENQPSIPEEDFDRTLWGEMESESSEEEEDEELDGDKEDETGLVTPAEGLVTPSGFSSIPAGMETPESIEIRKRKIEAEMEGGDTPALYTVLPEKKVDKIGSAMMGSTHIYDVAASAGSSKQKVNTTFVPNQGVEVALDPNELEMDPAQMTARYEQGLREQQSQLAKEDLSDMVAEYQARQKKRKKQQQDGGKAKKYKEFKF